MRTTITPPMHAGGLANENLAERMCQEIRRLRPVLRAEGMAAAGKLEKLDEIAAKLESEPLDKHEVRAINLALQSLLSNVDLEGKPNRSAGRTPESWETRGRAIDYALQPGYLQFTGLLQHRMLELKDGQAGSTMGTVDLGFLTDGQANKLFDYLERQNDHELKETFSPELTNQKRHDKAVLRALMELVQSGGSMEVLRQLGQRFAPGNAAELLDGLSIGEYLGSIAVGAAIVFDLAAFLMSVLDEDTRANTSLLDKALLGARLGTDVWLLLEPGTGTVASLGLTVINWGRRGGKLSNPERTLWNLRKKKKNEVSQDGTSERSVAADLLVAAGVRSSPA